MPRARLQAMEVLAQDGRAPDDRGKVLTLESRPHSSRAPIKRDGTATAPRLLLAEADKVARALLLPWLSGLSAEIEEARDGDALERALVTGPRFHLVIASARLPEPSALQVLARVRRQGVTTPFIVVTSVHGNMLRIFMSDSEGTVLSSRMVDGHNLATLICDMIESQR